MKNAALRFQERHLQPHCCFLHLLIRAVQPLVFSDLAPGPSGAGDAGCQVVYLLMSLRISDLNFLLELHLMCLICTLLLVHYIDKTSSSSLCVSSSSLSRECVLICQDYKLQLPLLRLQLCSSSHRHGSVCLQLHL